jgi:hypothetical protein
MTGLCLNDHTLSPRDLNNRASVTIVPFLLATRNRFDTIVHNRRVP